MEGCLIPFRCFGNLPESSRRFSKSFDANQKILKKYENLKFWLQGPDLGEKDRTFHANLWILASGSELF